MSGGTKCVSLSGSGCLMLGIRGGGNKGKFLGSKCGGNCGTLCLSGDSFCPSDWLIIETGCVGKRRIF